MGLGSGAATVTAVAVVVGGVLLLSPEPAANHSPVEAPATTTASRVEYVWPTVQPGTVLQEFALPAEKWAAGHRGVDLGLAVGAPVHVAADGIVAFAGVVAGRGVVSVDHADGIRTTYEPVTAGVGRGQRVPAGHVLGLLEAQGHHCAPESCLHWGARRGRDDYVDPLSLLTEDVVIRLLPERRL